MSGGGGGRSDVGSGGERPDECNAIEVVTPLNSPTAAVVAVLQRGDMLTVRIHRAANNVQTLVAEDHQGRVAGSLTPPSLLTIIRCIESGTSYGATVLDDPSGGHVRVRIRAQP